MKSVCFASHPSLVGESKAFSVGSHPWSSHRLSWLQLSPLRRYLPKSVLQVPLPEPLLQSCLPKKQVLFLNLDNFDLIVACFDRVRITVFYSAVSLKIKSLTLMDWTFIFFFLTDMLQGLKQFVFFLGIRECQSHLLASFFIFWIKALSKCDMYITLKLRLQNKI